MKNKLGLELLRENMMGPNSVRILEELLPLSRMVERVVVEGDSHRDHAQQIHGLP